MIMRGVIAVPALIIAEIVIECILLIIIMQQ